MFDDFRIAARLARKDPGTTTAIFFTLALGIGGATAIFSLVNCVLLRPLPVRDEHSLVRIFATDSRSQQDDVSMADYLDWKRELHSFSALAICNTSQATLAGSTAERVVTVETEWNLLPVLGVNVLHGRNFLPEENRPGRDGEAILSWSFWESHFGGGQLIGRKLILDGRSHVIIGILPRDFTLLGHRDIFLPLQIVPSAAENQRGYHGYAVFGRLAPGASLSQANAELSAFSASLAKAFPRENKGVGAKAVGLRNSISGEGIGSSQTNARVALLLLLAAVLCVLVIACGNVANINLVRAWSRQREFALRIALGAGRFQLSRQLLVESLLLSVSAALAGIVLAVWVVRLITKLPVTAVPRLEETTVDWRVLSFALLMGVVTGLGSAMAPIFRINAINLNSSLKEAGTRTTESKFNQKLRRFFVSLQTALAAALLIECSLLTKSFAKVSQIDPSFAVDHLLTVYFSLPAVRYGARPAEITLAVINDVLQRVRGLAGVTSAAVTSDLPLTGTAAGAGVTVQGQPNAPQFWNAPYSVLADISPRYFETLKVPFISGKDFSDNDNRRLVAIVNQALVRKLFPAQNPLGKRISTVTGHLEWREIIGVVEDVPQTAIEKKAEPQVFLPLIMLDAPWLGLAVRVNGDPERYVTPIRAEVGKVDPAIAVFLPRTMNQILEKHFLWRKVQTWVVGSFAVLAVTLASLGVYSVIAYAVRQRQTEMGIRMALGATAGELLRLVVWQGVKPALIGAPAGLIAGFVAARATTSLLFGTDSNDVAVYATVATILVIVASAASLLPAIRASVTEPSTVLRHE
jgi:putative ABC transport system permease protein